jgi:hypothetical protein
VRDVETHIANQLLPAAIRVRQELGEQVQVVVVGDRPNDAQTDSELPAAFATANTQAWPATSLV